jgi:hypothetical protein
MKSWAVEWEKYGFLAGVKRAKLVEDQGGDPVRITRVNSPRKLDEGLQLPFVPWLKGGESRWEEDLPCRYHDTY